MTVSPLQTDGTLVFTGTETFQALKAAQEWCREHGISYGSSSRMNRTGLLIGDFVIAKWHNLTRAERNALDGTMYGDFRDGPVVITMKRPVTPASAQAGDA